MPGFLMCSILTATVMLGDKTSAEPVWLKDYAEAKAKALRENKAIFAVFR